MNFIGLPPGIRKRECDKEKQQYSSVHAGGIAL
jgi:hypothetical protein